MSLFPATLGETRYRGRFGKAEEITRCGGKCKERAHKTDACWQQGTGSTCAAGAKWVETTEDVSEFSETGTPRRHSGMILQLQPSLWDRRDYFPPVSPETAHCQLPLAACEFQMMHILQSTLWSKQVMDKELLENKCLIRVGFKYYCREEFY